MVVFNYESRFCLWWTHGRMRIRRLKGERHYLALSSRRYTGIRLGLMVQGFFQSRRCITKVLKSMLLSYYKHKSKKHFPTEYCTADVNTPRSKQYGSGVPDHQNYPTQNINSRFKKRNAFELEVTGTRYSFLSIYIFSKFWYINYQRICTNIVQFKTFSLWCSNFCLARNMYKNRC